MKHEEREVQKMVKINLLTYLTLQFNSLVDKEKGMTLKETRQLCEQKTILRELQERFPFKETHFDLSLLKLQPDAEAEIENIFYDMAISLRDSEVYVANNGLCLLIAYAQEQIQREARLFTEKDKLKH
jgi:hypothetical protein